MQDDIKPEAMNQATDGGDNPDYQAMEGNNIVYDVGTTKPNKYMHFMVDTETLGPGPHSLVYQIGAVEFHPDTGVNHMSAFIETINVENYPGSVDISTIEWMLNQAASTGSYPKLTGGSHPNQVWFKFVQFIKDHSIGSTPIIWCNGTDFDIPKITLGIEQCVGKDYLPWKYDNVRDFRTIRKLFGQRFPKDVPAHNALQDCIQQAERLIAIVNTMDHLQFGDTWC